MTIEQLKEKLKKDYNYWNEEKTKGDSPFLIGYLLALNYVIELIKLYEDVEKGK
jgi:hypothetical protein